MVFGLLEAFLHFIFEEVFWFNQAELVDKLDEVLAGHSLPIVVHNSLTEDLKDLVGLLELDWACVFAKNKKLYEFKSIKVLFLDVFEPHIRIHVVTFIIKRIQLWVELEDSFKPLVFSVLMIDHCVDSNVEEGWNWHF